MMLLMYAALGVSHKRTMTSLFHQLGSSKSTLGPADRILVLLARVRGSSARASLEFDCILYQLQDRPFLGKAQTILCMMVGL